MYHAPSPARVAFLKGPPNQGGTTGVNARRSSLQGTGVFLFTRSSILYTDP